MKILILTDKYYPRPFANAICAQELIRVWKKQGHSIDVLAYKDFDGNPKLWESNKIYHVKPDNRLRLFYYANTYPLTRKGKWAKLIANMVSKVKGLILLPWQPFWSFCFPHRIYKTMLDLQVKNNYDAIISILKPLDSNIAACKFKEVHPEIPYVVFCVDSMKKAIVEKYIGRGFADGFFWEKRILEKCDAFFYMKSRRNNYLQHRYDSLRSKLLETDLPRFKVKDITKIPKYDFGEKGEHWVYAGSIGGVHYNPSQMIEIFNSIASSPKRILHLFTRGNEADKLKAMSESHHWNIRVHGYVDVKTLESIMGTADVIVSLKTSDQISAKIFECMSYGKPIVHFSGHMYDPDVQYIKQYRLSKIVRMYSQDVGEEIEKLKRFLKEDINKTIDPSELLETFKLSTPEYSANAIMKVLHKKK